MEARESESIGHSLLSILSWVPRPVCPCRLPPSTGLAPGIRGGIRWPRAPSRPAVASTAWQAIAGTAWQPLEACYLGAMCPAGLLASSHATLCLPCTALQPCYALLPCCCPAALLCPAAALLPCCCCPAALLPCYTAGGSRLLARRLAPPAHTGAAARLPSPPAVTGAMGCVAGWQVWSGWRRSCYAAGREALRHWIVMAVLRQAALVRPLLPACRAS